MISKRMWWINTGFLLLLGSIWWVQHAVGDAYKREDGKHVTMSLDEARVQIRSGEALGKIPNKIWRELLGERAYNVLWNKGTERAFTGELLNESREGVYVTAGCRIPVFKSDHKFKSGTGWPSFWEVFDEDNIVLKEDRSWGMKRIEVLSKCGEHLGHVFDDGPEPTGLRYCINSAALAFVPSGERDPFGPYAAPEHSSTEK